MVAGRETTCPRTRHDHQRCCFDQGFRVIRRTASVKDGRQNFMKRCPECRRDYYDDTLSFCLDDGSPLVYGMSSENIMADRTEMLPTISDQLPSGILDRFTTTRTSSGRKRAAVLAGLAAVILAGLFFGYRYVTPNGDRINSVAVMPLRPLNDDEDTKALGLGLTDALITKLGSLRQVVVRPTSAITEFGTVNDS